MAVLCACGERAPGTPFAAVLTPELRAAVIAACADPVTGSDVETEPYGSVQSSGRCYLRVDFDEETRAIRYLVFGSSDSIARAEQIMREIILPTLKPEQRRWLEEQVLADLGADENVELVRRGGGEITYRNRSLAGSAAPNLSLTIGRR